MTLTSLEKKLVQAMRNHEVLPPAGKNWTEKTVKKIAAKQKLFHLIKDEDMDISLYFIFKMQRTLIGIKDEGMHRRMMHEESMDSYDFGELFTGHWYENNSDQSSMKNLFRYMPK